MTEIIQSRGPDGEGFYEDPAITLGHRRLSIIDIAGGAQPMCDESGRYHLVFNGEIYNYIELREELKARGCTFKTASDTEVLLQFLVLEGMAALRRFNGMFAFAFWDKEQRVLCLARDRIGIKPLYYCERDGDLVFASEMKALQKHPRVDNRINSLSLSKYLSFGYVPAPHTIFERIYKLDPGTYLRFDEHGLRKEIYWDIPLEDNPISGRNVDECAEEFLELLTDSVSKRLRSDVPVGVFLSGGVDSSLITAIAARTSPNKVHSFSVGFEESSYDESPYALQVAKQYGTEHHHEILSSRRALDLMPEVLSKMDEPFSDASIIPTYLLSHFTSQEVKVVLGGDGGDELFAGYPSFQAHRIMEKLSFLPVPLRDALTRLARKIPVSHRYASVDFLLQQFFKGAGISPEIRFFIWMGYFGHDQKRHVLSESVRHELLRKNPYEDVIRYVSQSGLVSDFERILYLSMKMYLQDDILVKVDRASMSHSLEVRVPFLDHNVVEYVSGVHSAYKLRGLKTKYLLKRSAESLLPKNIVHRRKAGFMMPVATWLKGELKPIVEETLLGNSGEDSLFDETFVRTLLDEHHAHTKDNRKLIWNLYCFHVWRQHYG